MAGATECATHISITRVAGTTAETVASGRASTIVVATKAAARLPRTRVATQTPNKPPSDLRPRFGRRKARPSLRRFGARIRTDSTNGCPIQNSVLRTWDAHVKDDNCDNMSAADPRSHAFRWKTTMLRLTCARRRKAMGKASASGRRMESGLPLREPQRPKAIFRQTKNTRPSMSVRTQPFHRCT